MRRLKGKFEPKTKLKVAWLWSAAMILFHKRQLKFNPLVVKSDFRHSLVANRAKKPRKKPRDHIVAHHAEPAFYVFVDAPNHGRFPDIKRPKKQNRERKLHGRSAADRNRQPNTRNLVYHDAAMIMHASFSLIVVDDLNAI